MAIVFKPQWNQEIKSYAQKFGPYQAYLSSFTDYSISRALFEAAGHFNDPWVRNFIKYAMDPFDKAHVVTVEQGTHQAEDTTGKGFCLHFTGRDADGYALHFYLDQNQDGKPRIFEITYMDHGRPVSIYRR